MVTGFLILVEKETCLIRSVEECEVLNIWECSNVLKEMYYGKKMLKIKFVAITSVLDDFVAKNNGYNFKIYKLKYLQI